VDHELLLAIRIQCAGLKLKLHGNKIVQIRLLQFFTCRQSSLPSASSDLSLPEGELEWPETIEIEGERVELRKKNRDVSCTSSYDSMEGKYVFLII